MSTSKATVLGRTKKPLERVARRPLRVRTCRCGQDLDMCTRAHCPRCGSTLKLS